MCSVFHISHCLACSLAMWHTVYWHHLSWIPCWLD